MRFALLYLLLGCTVPTPVQHRPPDLRERLQQGLDSLKRVQDSLEAIRTGIPVGCYLAPELGHVICPDVKPAGPPSSMIRRPCPIKPRKVV